MDLLTRTACEHDACCFQEPLHGYTSSHDVKYRQSVVCILHVLLLDQINTASTIATIVLLAPWSLDKLVSVTRPGRETSVAKFRGSLTFKRG